MTLSSQDKTNLYFSSLSGQGVIYNIIVRDPLWNTSAAYVPAHTYACSFTALKGRCQASRESLECVFLCVHDGGQGASPQWDLGGEQMSLKPTSP